MKYNLLPVIFANAVETIRNHKTCAELLPIEQTGRNTIAHFLPFYLIKTQHDCALFTFLPGKNKTRLRTFYLFIFEKTPHDCAQN
jgi:hypothetical protein